MKEIERFFLSLILLSAGILHLVRPEVFDPAIFWGYKELSNVAAGVLELILALLLLVRPGLGARLTALWLVVLLPVHIYVSVNAIPMFGIDSRLFLWGRTLLQLPLILWAWSISKPEQ
jgi:uncharacterized membrane protein